MKTKILLNKLAKRYPKRIAKIYHDHVGHMTGKIKENTNKILLCLDLEWEILEEVKKVKPDLIITHHPFIYGTKYRVFKYDESKKDLCAEIDKLDIPVYSYHTNFDAGKDGMNDALAQQLGLTNIYAPEAMGMMRIGQLKEEMDVVSFAKMAKEKFGVDYSLLIDEGKKKVQKVGIIGGGGSHDWDVAQLENCDIYISGDAPHHVRRSIVNKKYNYLDMPHEIEHIFMPQMQKILLEIDPNLEIICIDHEKLPKVI